MGAVGVEVGGSGKGRRGFGHALEPFITLHFKVALQFKVAEVRTRGSGGGWGRWER